MNAFDLSIFYWLNSFFGKSAVQDFFIVAFASYLLYFILFASVCSAYVYWKKHHVLTPYLFVFGSALIARFIVGSGIRFFYHRPRPFVVLDIPHMLTGFSYSFPSGHAIFMFALATSVYFFNKRLALVLFVAALCAGIARVAAGVHYPSDIVGGAVLGILTSVLLRKLYVWYAKSA